MSSSSECCEDVSTVKFRLLNLLCELDESGRDEVARWFISGEYRKDIKTFQSYRKQRGQAEKIAAKLRTELELEAVMPTERIVYPTVGDLADCTARDTLHVDEFLYDDRRVDELVERGTLSRHYCVECGSRHVKELTMISHSTGLGCQLYMFKFLLPRDLSGLQVLDIGSRLGAVLYGVYYFTNASKIVGVEINKELCELQNKCLKNFHLDDRISVVNSDITKETELIQSSDIVTLNVVDFFIDPLKQIEMWRFFKATMTKGTMLLTLRGVPETLSSLGVYEEFEDWLAAAEPMQTENEVFVGSDYCDVYFYKVK